MSTTFLWNAGTSNNGLLVSPALSLMTNTELASLASTDTVVSSTTGPGSNGIINNSVTGQGLLGEVWLKLGAITGPLVAGALPVRLVVDLARRWDDIRSAGQQHRAAAVPPTSSSPCRPGRLRARHRSRRRGELLLFSRFRSRSTCRTTLASPPRRAATALFWRSSPQSRSRRVELPPTIGYRCNHRQFRDHNWSNTVSGGPGGFGPPSTGDIAIFDSNGAGTCTIAAAVTVQAFDCQGGRATHAGTIAHNAFTITINSSGNGFRLASGMTYTPSAVTSIVAFTNTSGTANLTSAGHAFAAVTVNGAGGTVQQQDNLSVNAVTGAILHPYDRDVR